MYTLRDSFSKHDLSLEHFEHNFYRNENAINDISKYDMIVAKGTSNPLLTYAIKQHATDVISESWFYTATLFAHFLGSKKTADVKKLAFSILFSVKTRKPRKGAAVIAASMHGFASCRKFKSPVTLTLTLDRVKVIST